MQAGDKVLDVQDDLRHIFLHAGDSGKLMLDAGDLDGGHGRAGQGAEQHPPQGVAKGGAVAPLQRFHDEFPIALVGRALHTFDTRLLDLYHVFLPSFGNVRHKALRGFQLTNL